MQAAAWQVHSDSYHHWTHCCALRHGPNLGSPMNHFLLLVWNMLPAPVHLVDNRTLL